MLKSPADGTCSDRSSSPDQWLLRQTITGIMCN